MDRALHMAETVAMYRSASGTQSIKLTLESDHKGYKTEIPISKSQTIGRYEFVENDYVGGHINREWLVCDFKGGVWTINANDSRVLRFEIRRGALEILRGDVVQPDQQVKLQSGDRLVFPSRSDCDRECARERATGFISASEEPCTLRALRYGTPVCYEVHISAATLANPIRQTNENDTADDGDMKKDGSMEEDDMKKDDAVEDDGDVAKASGKSEPTKTSQSQQTCVCGAKPNNLKLHQKFCREVMTSQPQGRSTGVAGVARKRHMRSTTNPGLLKKQRQAQVDESPKKRTPSGRQQCRLTEPFCKKDADDNEDDNWIDKAPRVGDPTPIWKIFENMHKS